jgi:hypothetical protein
VALTVHVTILYKMTEEKVPGSKYVNVLADNISSTVKLGS